MSELNKALDEYMPPCAFYPDAFYPDNSSDVGRELTKLALANCAVCEIRNICQEDAVRRGEMYGIWGGTTEKQREEIIRKRGRANSAS